VGELRLEVREFQDLTRWRWALTGPGGTLAADHEVRLDPRRWECEAFGDLLNYLDWHAAPDRRAEDEARIVAGVGAWIGAEVFGPVAAAMVKARPATVRVVVPEEARALLFRPLELAHVGGKPLSLQDVTLVMQLAGGSDGAGAAPVRERLRVLGLFSLPEGGQPLNLRRERYALVRLLEGIAAESRAVDVRVLQYGVTRDRLRDVLEEDEGWDVIHISGHGAPGVLLLEKPDGSRDLVTAGELADLLDLARERVKLVTVSACWSAALTAAEQRRLLGLPAAGGGAARAADRDGAGGAVDGGGGGRTAERGDGRGTAEREDGFAPGTLATELAGRLGCAVLAMRYPVVDDFAIGLAAKLYDLLAAKGRPLPRALGIALGEVVAVPPTPACPALSAGTPALFGARAVNLRLAAPRREHAESYDTGTLKMAGFPPQPDRFVGRTGVMARASAALADASGVPGVLLHGMPGGGKTACALELAYTHEHAFDRLVWFKAPDEGQDITGALAEFALTLERELPGFQMVHVLADEARLAGFLPKLTELAERRRVLIVIDNVESLLSGGGEWRDTRWGSVVGALCGHAGRGRVVLTSRRLPSGVAGLRVLAVDALSLDEALLLARELPHLRALIEGELAGIERDVARRLALGVLGVAQGHPKLLELAEGQAADPARLSALVEAGDQAWRQAGGLPDGFFATGESRAAGEDYLGVLGAWTDAVAGGLSLGPRTLFWFLCCLEEGDRIRFAVDGNWGDLWIRLGLDGQPPGLDETLAALAARGLIAVRPETEESNESYGIHPGVADAGRARAGTEFRDAVDAELAAYWSSVAEYALGREGEARTSGLVVRAGLAAAPYLMRRGEWSAAGSLLERAFHRDPSRATAAAVLPALRAITVTGLVPGAADLLALVLALIDPAAAESQMRAVLGANLARGDYRLASVTAGRLINVCRESGQLAEALTLADQMIGYTRRAGLGPWTQLLGEVSRLQVLNDMGQAEQVLAEVQRLREHMETLPVRPGEPEPVYPWNVRGSLLAVGRDAARQLGRWDDALELNSAVAAIAQDRGAPAGDIAQIGFNDYGPLIRLGRIDEALALLLYCRQAFESAHDIRGLGVVLGALADVEDKRGHGNAAISLGQDALRYEYLARDVSAITVSYHNLGNYLGRHARQTAAALAHHLASALICALTDAEGVDESVRAAAADMQTAGADTEPPADVADLCRRVAGIPGTDLDRLITLLAPDPDTAERTLRELVARIRDLAEAPPTDRRHLAEWDPVIAAVLAADGGDTRAVAALDTELDRLQDSSDWGALVAALRRLRAGDTGTDLLTGLDEVDAAIVTRAIDARDGKITIPAALWGAIGIGPLLLDLVDAAGGDAGAAGRAGEDLKAMAEDPGLSALASALRRILGGDCDSGLAGQVDDPVERAVVETVLGHIGAG